MSKQAVAGQNDWRFLYLSSLSLAEGAEAEKGVFRGPAGEIPHTTGRVPPAGAGGRRTMRNSAVVIEKGKSWRTKHAYSPWRPSGTPLPQNREGGHLLCRCPPFGTPDQTLTGGLPLRSLACPMPYGTDIIYGDSSFVIHFEVQGFCGAICTKCRVLPHFLRRPISKLLAGIALPTTSFHHALSPCH